MNEQILLPAPQYVWIKCSLKFSHKFDIQKHNLTGMVVYIGTAVTVVAKIVSLLSWRDELNPRPIER